MVVEGMPRAKFMVTMSALWHTILRVLHHIRLYHAFGLFLSLLLLFPSHVLSETHAYEAQPARFPVHILDRQILHLGPSSVGISLAICHQGWPPPSADSSQGAATEAAPHQAGCHCMEGYLIMTDPLAERLQTSHIRPAVAGPAPAS